MSNSRCVSKQFECGGGVGANYEKANMLNNQLIKCLAFGFLVHCFIVIQPGFFWDGSCV